MAGPSHGNTWQTVPNNARKRKQPKPKYWCHFMRLFAYDPSLKRVREMIYDYAWAHEPRDTGKKDFVVSEMGVERNAPRVHFAWHHHDGTMHKKPHRDSICNLHLVCKKVSTEFLGYVYSHSSLEIDVDLKAHETAESTAALQRIVASLDRTPNFKRHTRDVRVRIHFPYDYPRHCLPGVNQDTIEQVADRLDCFSLSKLSVDVVMMHGYDDYELRLSTFAFYPITFRDWSIQLLDTATGSWENLSRETQRRLDTAWDVYKRDGPINGWAITGQLKPEIFPAHGATTKRTLADGKGHHQKAEAHEPKSPKAADDESHHRKIGSHEPEPKKAKSNDVPHKKDIDPTRYQQGLRVQTPSQGQAKSGRSRPEAAASGRLSSAPSRQASPESSVAETLPPALATPASPKSALLEPPAQTPSVLSATASDQDCQSGRQSSSGTRANSPALTAPSTPKPALPLALGTQRATIHTPAPGGQTPHTATPVTPIESASGLEVSTENPVLEHQVPSQPAAQPHPLKPTVPAPEADPKDGSGSVAAPTGETQAAKKGKKKKKKKRKPKPKSGRQNKTSEEASTGSSGGAPSEKGNSLPHSTRPEFKPGSPGTSAASSDMFVSDSSVPEGSLREATKSQPKIIIVYPDVEAEEHADAEPVDTTKYSEVIPRLLHREDATEGEAQRKSPERPFPKAERRTRHQRSSSVRRREARAMANHPSLVAAKQGGTEARFVPVNMEDPYSSMRSFEETAVEVGSGTEQEALEAIDPASRISEPQVRGDTSGRRT